MSPTRSSTKRRSSSCASLAISSDSKTAPKSLKEPAKHQRIALDLKPPRGKERRGALLSKAELLKFTLGDAHDRLGRPAPWERISLGDLEDSMPDGELIARARVDELDGDALFDVSRTLWEKARLHDFEDRRRRNCAEHGLIEFRRRRELVRPFELEGHLEEVGSTVRIRDRFGQFPERADERIFSALVEGIGVPKQREELERISHIALAPTLLGEIENACLATEIFYGLLRKFHAAAWVERLGAAIEPAKGIAKDRPSR